jgi:ribosomal protein S18 acetylase RimI-like enzyme
MPETVTLRPVAPADERFLRSLYGSTRQAALAPLGWSALQADVFLDMQFQARELHYRSQFPGAGDCLVLVGGAPAGRLYVERGEVLIRIVDIAMAPRYRGQGAGTALLGGLIEEASDAGKVVELHVERDNPAQRMYRRLGFVEAGGVSPYLRMQWRPRPNG